VPPGASRGGRLASMEATAVLGAVTAAAGSVKAVVEAINAARAKAKGNKAAMAALVEAHDLALSLQTSLFEAKEQAFALQEENRQLREENRQLQAKISECEARALDREDYELKKMRNNVAVVPKGETSPLYCPSCFEANELNILGNTGFTSRDNMPSHVCPVCQNYYELT